MARSAANAGANSLSGSTRAAPRDRSRSRARLRRPSTSTSCDAFNCRSDAFYVVNPNPARARQWAKDRSEGKKPSTLYQPKATEPLNGNVEAQDEVVQGEKRTSLRATFTDPRALFRKRVESKEQRM